VNVGILGGTFDPIHIGHLIVAEEARVKLQFDRVLFVPAGQPWLKVDRNITPAIHRVEMVRRAIVDNPHFELCTLEIERHGPSYTVDTLAKLQEQLGREASLFFLLGHDALAELPLWKEPKKVAQLCRLVVAPRLGSKGLRRLQAEIPGLLDKIVQLDMPIIAISSSEIRHRIARRLSIRYLVPAQVAEYITEHEIYPTVATARDQSAHHRQ
jgi:nicotinate-nucleotide adenylyltransferase